MSEIKIVIYMSDDKLQTAVSFKNLIGDTLEERGVGEVIDEGIFLDTKQIDIFLEVDEPSDENITEIKSILHSLGISKADYLITLD